MNGDANVMSSKPDFPDWISPMLVKELRQGMRSRVFLFCFLAVQAAMIYLALVGLLSASADESTTEVSVFFWIIVGLPLLMIMPFSGLGAIAREKTGNTLELIFLTRLTARRIVFGKWVAIIAQTLLLVTAILPYAVMRYYIGGVDVSSELTVLAWMLLGSAVLSSVMVGISASIGRVGRVLMPFGLFFALYAGAIVTSVFGMGSSTWSFNWLAGVFVGLQAILMMLLMLEMGAGRIGPEAENHSTSKRLVAAVSVLATVLYSLAPRAPTWIWWPAVIIALPVLVGAVCEPVREVPSVYRPFLRFGFAGRALGRLLYPGWPSGVLFALLVLGVATYRLDVLATGMHVLRFPGVHRVVRITAAGMMSPPMSMPSAVSGTNLVLIRIREAACIGAFFFPVALLRFVRRRLPFPSVIYFLVHGALSLFSLIGTLCTEYGIHHASHPGPSGIEQLVACIPTCALLLSSRIRNWDPNQMWFVLSGLLVVTACSILIPLVRMWPAWRRITTLEKIAASLPPAANQADVPRSEATV